MARTYRTPTVASLGAAEIVTSACGCKRPFNEPTSGLSTTHSVLDL